MQNTYLAHHGILNMKWGKRNGPPYPLDSSPQRQAAKKRKAERRAASSMSDEELQSVVKRKNLEKAYDKATGKKDKLEASRQIADETRNVANRSKDAIRKIPDKPKERLDMSDMTEQEMRARINRELLERQYDNLFNTNKSDIALGKEFAIEAIDLIGDIAGIAAGGLSIALLLKQLGVW